MWGRAALRQMRYAVACKPCGTGAVCQRREGRSKKYDLARLAYLAPDITGSILAGSQPRSFSLRKLLRGMPLAWADQRRRFGYG